MLIKGEQGEEACISKNIMKILTSDSRGENCSYFSSYDGQTQSDSAEKIQVISPTKSQGGSAGATPGTQASQYPTDMGCLQSTELQEMQEDPVLWQCPSASPDCTPDAPKEKQECQKPGSCHLPPLTGHHHSLFHYPSHKITITISPLNTFSPFVALTTTTLSLQDIR